MSLTPSQESCKCLNILIQLLKKNHIEAEVNRKHNDMAIVLSSLLGTINECSERFRQLIDKCSLIWDTNDDGIRIIDMMIRLLSVIHESEDEHFALTDIIIIQLSLTQLMTLTFLSSLKKHFKRIDHLFQSHMKIQLNCDIKLLTKNDDLLILCQKILEFSKTNSFLTHYVFEHCFAPIIGMLLILKHENQLSQEIDNVLSHVLSNDYDQVLVIRNLLLLLRYEPNQWANIEISKSLSKCLISQNGIINLIKSVIDNDETSQKETTHEQRYSAIATVISAMPKLCCSLNDYYANLAPQLFQLLNHRDANYGKIGVMIVNSLEQRSYKLTHKYIIGMIINTVKLLPENECHLLISQSIEMIHRLITYRYDIKKFMTIAGHIFYMRVILENSLSYLKKVLDEIFYEIITSVDKSEYLFDNILFNCQSYANLYEMSDENEIKRKIRNENDDLNIHQIDVIVQLTVKIISKMNDSFKVNLFLLFLERMTLSSPSLLVCSLVGTVHEEVSSLMSKYTEKSIQFVVTTLERIASQQTLNKIIITDDDDLNNDDNFMEMQRQSIAMCLQIVGILVKEKSKLKSKDICKLIQCSASLEILSKTECIDETLKEIASDLKKQINELSHSESFSHSDDYTNEKTFEKAMRELNDPLMPVRAHSLIVLKQLIYSKDKEIIKNKDHLINAFQMCLNDEESYIYLMAINSLSAFAIIYTDDVIPILMKEYNDPQRSVRERLIVGEVLVQLSRSIGDFAHHYSSQFIHTFLIGTKSCDSAIRVSSLSNLGQFCAVLKYALKPYIVEILLCVQSLLETDPDLDVKRASVMFFHTMLNAIDANLIEIIQDHLRDIYRVLRKLNTLALDDVLRLHSQLAIEQIDRITREWLTPKQDLVKKIKILQL